MGPSSGSRTAAGCEHPGKVWSECVAACCDWGGGLRDLGLGLGGGDLIGFLITCHLLQGTV